MADGQILSGEFGLVGNMPSKKMKMSCTQPMLLSPTQCRLYTLNTEPRAHRQPGLGQIITRCLASSSGFSLGTPGNLTSGGNPGHFVLATGLLPITVVERLDDLTRRRGWD